MPPSSCCPSGSWVEIHLVWSQSMKARCFLLGSLIVVGVTTGCGSREPQPPSAAVYAYIDAVNQRDSSALEQLAPPAYEPKRYAEWVMERAPAQDIEGSVVSVTGEFPDVKYVTIKWRDKGVPADGLLALNLVDGQWRVGPLSPAPGLDGSAEQSSAAPSSAGSPS